MEKTLLVLAIRIDADLTRSLERESRRRRKTKSEVARAILAAGLEMEEENPIAQALRERSSRIHRADSQC